jgi:hypothetical protein
MYESMLPFYYNGHNKCLGFSGDGKPIF